MWDVIVVGARCAGAASALRFARSRRSVLMLDKARLASDTLSTHVLVPPAIKRLKDLGLLDKVCATGAPPVHTFLVEFDGKAFPSPIQGPSDFLFSVRRTSLDPLLVTAALQAGVTARHQVQVEGLLWKDDQVAGVSYRDRTGEIVSEHAHLVVGADGRHSRVAQQVRALEYNILECDGGAFYAYFHGIGSSVAGADVVQFASGPQSDVLCCPGDGDLHVVLLIVSREEFTQLNAEGASAYQARLRTIPTLAPRLKHAGRVGKLHPANPRELRGYFRKPYGSGCALAGDAGYYAHPAAANGIADALRSAEVVHTLVERAWTEGQPATTYLDEYQRTCDAENTQEFCFSYRSGQVNPFDDPEVAAAVTGGRSKDPMP